VAEPVAPRVAAVRAAAERVAPRVIELATQIATIPAPTGDEGARSRFLADLFASAGLAVERDELGDVVARLPGQSNERALLLAAHLDTVFPAGTDLLVREEAGLLRGPGIGDNSLGVAAVAMLPEMLRHLGVQPATDILLTGNVGEEGLGNLRGMRAVVDAHPDIGAAIAVEGQTLGRVTHIAVGSRRLRITLRGPGGHSWGDYGRPSAIHALGRLITALADLPVPSQPKTSLNVGLVSGGISVNTIAPAASCVVDMRSTDPEELRRLADRVEAAVAASAGGEISADVEELGVRPAGQTPPGSPIVQIATETLAALGIEAVCDASSTDANIPIARGIPAVCIGITRGGHAHRTDEFIELAPVPLGLAQLALLTLQVSEALASRAPDAPATNAAIS